MLLIFLGCFNICFQISWFYFILLFFKTKFIFFYVLKYNFLWILERHFFPKNYKQTYEFDLLVVHSRIILVI